MTNLEQLLRSISSNEVPVQDLENFFDEIAEELLWNTKIVTPSSQFYISEVEFYFRSPTHKDPYVHGKEGCISTAARQGHFGEWYFHGLIELENFLKINRKGVDITFGNKDERIYGGILIRKINNIANGTPIIGINKVARALIEGVNNRVIIQNIGTTSGNKVFDNQQSLYLDSSQNETSEIIYKTTRFGLNPKKDESNEFFNKKLCYFSHSLFMNLSNITQVRPAL